MVRGNPNSKLRWSLRTIRNSAHALKYVPLRSSTPPASSGTIGRGNRLCQASPGPVFSPCPSHRAIRSSYIGSFEGKSSTPRATNRTRGSALWGEIDAAPPTTEPRTADNALRVAGSEAYSRCGLALPLMRRRSSCVSSHWPPRNNPHQAESVLPDTLVFCAPRSLQPPPSALYSVTRFCSRASFT